MARLSRCSALTVAVLALTIGPAHADTATSTPPSPMSSPAAPITEAPREPPTAKTWDTRDQIPGGTAAPDRSPAEAVPAPADPAPRPSPAFLGEAEPRPAESQALAIQQPTVATTVVEKPGDQVSSPASTSARPALDSGASGEPAAASPRFPALPPAPVWPSPGGVEGSRQPPHHGSADHERLRLLVAEARVRLARVRDALERARRSLDASGRQPDPSARRELRTSLDALAPILDALEPSLRAPVEAGLGPDFRQLRRELALAAWSAEALLAALDRSGASGPAVERLRARLRALRARATDPTTPLRPASTLPALARAAYTQAHTAGQSATRTTVSTAQAASAATRPSDGSRRRDGSEGRRDGSTPPATEVAASASASGGASSPAGVSAALVALLGLLLPALARRLEVGPDGWRPLAFAAPLEHPG